MYHAKMVKCTGYTTNNSKCPSTKILTLLLLSSGLAPHLKDMFVQLMVWVLDTIRAIK